MGYSPRGRKESDQTEHLTLSLFHTTGIQVTLDVEGGLRDESPALGASNLARLLPCPLPLSVCGAQPLGQRDLMAKISRATLSVVTAHPTPSRLQHFPTL